MDIFGILDPDPVPHENLCGSETLYQCLNDFKQFFYLRYTKSHLFKSPLFSYFLYRYFVLKIFHI